MADINHAHETKEETNKTKDPRNKQRKDKRRSRKLDFDDEYGIRESEVSFLLYLSAENMQEERQKAIEKWNFDFENEIPLDGTWLWEKIPAQHLDAKKAVCRRERVPIQNRAV